MNHKHGVRIQNDAVGTFVAADLVAKLAGTDLRSVLRIMQTLAAVNKTTGIDYEILLDADNLPLSIPDQDRRDDCAAAAARVVGSMDRSDPVNSVVLARLGFQL